MPTQQNALLELNRANDLGEKLVHLHKVTRERYPFITRIAMALYDQGTDLVRTFIYSGDTSPLNHYQARLSSCHSLRQLADKRIPRLEQDLSVFKDSRHIHARKIYEAGYRGSYTLPLIFNDELIGFIFFNAEHENAFDQACLSYLDLIGELVGLLMFNAINTVRTLLSTVKSAVDLTYSRDPETGGHLQRMSRYSRTVARALSTVRERDDQFSEYVYLFAPLHDIGKITIPDNILLKPGRLTPDEFEEMKAHAENGRILASKLMQNYGLADVPYLKILLNIIACHHEAWDGSGYPKGLQGENIPLEARIVAVADVYDALTSRRPYKEPWSVGDALAEMKRMSGQKLDPECVDALVNNLADILEIQNSFVDKEGDDTGWR
ncbi:HD domain-containing phosphohydrolase [Marinobacter mobilis]|uniref:HD domain-containing protein n=1 Tax=Marinobacter mobilis TaxID=488533 RepID=A0A1H3A8D4_9GAMM|nr:HD domain-containing phosphohydrolase [Marinobacter mobilis]SDX26002.1 HD domain-containing protein [Marinobacter mobilis]